MDTVRGKQRIGLVAWLLTVVLSSVLWTGFTGGHRQRRCMVVHQRRPEGSRFTDHPTHLDRRYGGLQADWGNPDFADARTTRNPMHTYKDVFIDKTGKPLRENDYYQSGKQYHVWGSDPGELDPETLTITYDLGAARAGENPWHCEVIVGHTKRALPVVN